MPKICYQTKRFSESALERIQQANQILDAYAAQGFDLTLRQLYYQFVSRAIIPNKDTEYKRLGELISDARMAGLIDWNRITDRTRNLRDLAHWDSPQDIIDACASQFRLSKWKAQPNYVEVWVEKDALIGVVEQAANGSDVPCFSCRGYTSQSEMWSASQRLLGRLKAGKTVTILHLGDHDPSGIDMTRDIRERLSDFIGYHSPGFLARFHVNRIALTMDQIQQYNPPPNPAKVTDSRAGAYIAEYGDESWELDAIPPTDMAVLITEAVADLTDPELWQYDQNREDGHKADLGLVARSWESVVDGLKDGAGEEE